MSGVWKRSYGRPTKAPPDERGGNRHGRPNTTAPHPDSTQPGHWRWGPSSPPPLPRSMLRWPGKSSLVLTVKGTRATERRAIQPGPAVSVVNVLLYENVTGRFDLGFQDCDLALDRALFLLQVRAHAGVQDRLLHMLLLI